MAECPNPLAPSGDPYFKAGAKPACADLPALDPDNPTTGDPYYLNVPADVVLEPVRITIEDTADSSVEGANVVIFTETFALGEIGPAVAVAAGKTDANGQVIVNVPAGGYDVYVEKEGFVDWYDVINVPSDDPVGDYHEFTIQIMSMALNVGDGLSVSGAVGVYYATVYLGNYIGPVTFELNAQSVPDRFQILYDGEVVADSLYVGDGLASYYSSLIANSYDIPVYTLLPNKTFQLAGYNESFDPQVNEIASLDSADTRATGGHGDQLGVVPNYPSASARANDGNIKLRFFKSDSNITQCTLKVFGPVGSTLWDLFGIEICE